MGILKLLAPGSGPSSWCRSRLGRPVEAAPDYFPGMVAFRPRHRVVLPVPADRRHRAGIGLVVGVVRHSPWLPKCWWWPKPPLDAGRRAVPMAGPLEAGWWVGAGRAAAGRHTLRRPGAEWPYQVRSVLRFLGGAGWRLAAQRARRRRRAGAAGRPLGGGPRLSPSPARWALLGAVATLQPQQLPWDAAVLVPMLTAPLLICWDLENRAPHRGPSTTRNLPGPTILAYARRDPRALAGTPDQIKGGGIGPWPAHNPAPPLAPPPASGARPQHRPWIRGRRAGDDLHSLYVPGTLFEHLTSRAISASPNSGRGLRASPGRMLGGAGLRAGVFALPPVWPPSREIWSREQETSLTPSCVILMNLSSWRWASWPPMARWTGSTRHASGPTISARCCATRWGRVPSALPTMLHQFRLCEHPCRLYVVFPAAWRPPRCGGPAGGPGLVLLFAVSPGPVGGGGDHAGELPSPFRD